MLLSGNNEGKHQLIVLCVEAQQDKFLKHKCQAQKVYKLKILLLKGSRKAKFGFTLLPYFNLSLYICFKRNCSSSF